MLLINVPFEPNSPLTFSRFEYLEIPAPVGGVDGELNDNLVLKFANEEEANNYAEQLENLSTGLKDKSSEQNLAIGQLIMAIKNDSFVNVYLTQ